MPVSGRALGWLTGVFLALTETAAILWLHPRTTDLRVLALGWVLFSSAAGGLAAGAVHPGASAKRSGTWFAPVVRDGRRLHRRRDFRPPVCDRVGTSDHRYRSYAFEHRRLLGR